MSSYIIAAIAAGMFAGVCIGTYIFAVVTQ